MVAVPLKIFAVISPFASLPAIEFAVAVVTAATPAPPSNFTNSAVVDVPTSEPVIVPLTVISLNVLEPTVDCTLPKCVPVELPVRFPVTFPVTLPDKAPLLSNAIS